MHSVGSDRVLSITPASFFSLSEAAAIFKQTWAGWFGDFALGWHAEANPTTTSTGPTLPDTDILKSADSNAALADSTNISPHWLK